MCSHMDLYVSFFCESFMADVAFKWLLAGVGPFMYQKSALSLEALTAMSAAKGLLSCVDKLMSLQVPFGLKRLAAHFSLNDVITDIF